MNKFIILIILVISPPAVSEEIVRACGEVLVDEVTEMAFADQGQPFTGKVKCYYDNDTDRLKSERTFVDGIPTGTHYCYERDGSLNYSIIYDKGKRYKRGFITISTNKYVTVSCHKNGSYDEWCVKRQKSNCF